MNDKGWIEISIMLREEARKRKAELAKKGRDMFKRKNNRRI